MLFMVDMQEVKMVAGVEEEVEEEAKELVVEEDVIKVVRFEYTIINIIVAFMDITFIQNKRVKPVIILHWDILKTQLLPTTKVDHRETETSLSDMNHKLMSILINY